MDEAGGGVPETISSERVTEFDDEWQQIGFEANGKEYVKLLTEEIVKYGEKIQHLEKENRRIFDQVRKIFEDLLEENQKLVTEVEKLNDRVALAENEVKMMDEDLKSGSPKQLDSTSVMLFAFKAMYAEAKSVRAMRNSRDLPTHILLNSWKGIVEEKPDVSWTLNNVSHRRPSEKNFFYEKYSCHLKVILHLPSDAEAKHPFLHAFVQFESKTVPSRALPTIVAVIRRKKPELSRVERLYPAHFNGSSYHYVGTRYNNTFNMGNQCAWLGIDLFFELPFSAATVQSEIGVLYWTVEKFRELFQHDDEVLYSPYFATSKSYGERLQAVLYASAKDELSLQVVRRGRPGDPALYRVVVSVLRATRTGGSRSTFRRKSGLKNGETFDLGKMDDVVAGNTFLCKVIVNELPNPV